MLSLFPGLLSYSFLAITLLRISAAIYFIYIAYCFIAEQGAFEQVRNLPIIGRLRDWMVYLFALVTLIAGVLLFVGLWTQGAAVLGIIIALKSAIGRRWMPMLPLSTGAYILLAILCVALLFTGAGAFAFDLPL